MDFSLRSVKAIARAYPENLLFVPSGILTAVALNPDAYADEVRIPCGTELLLRSYLAGTPEVNGNVDQVFTGRERLALHRALAAGTDPVSLVGRPLWHPATSFSGACEVLVRSHLLRLFTATDGYIPVYDTADGKGYFLPFQLLTASPGDCPVVDNDGTPVSAWESRAQEVLGGEWRCRVHCRLTDDLPPLEGTSLLFPLRLARWRKEGELPPYDVRRLLATGGWEQGRIRPVAWREKARALPAALRDAWMLTAADGAPGDDEPNVSFFPAGTDEGTLLLLVRDFIEEKQLAVPTYMQAQMRIEEMRLEIAHLRSGNWQQMLNQLQTVGRPLSADRAPCNYLEKLELKSICLCRLGRTQEARDCNQEARRFAAANNLVREGLLLEVECLVQMLDQELFPEIREIFTDLEKRLQDYGDADLLMRFNGSMGLVCAYAAVSGRESRNSRIAAREYINAALRLNIKNGSERDIAQSRNYWHLWHALFMPCTREEQDAYEHAKNHICCNLQGDLLAKRKNLNYLCKQKANAYYRYWLQTGETPDIDLFSLEVPENTEEPIRACLYKYLGALAVAMGWITDGKRYFAEAVSALPPQDGVLGKIRFTALAQAWASLRKFDKETACGYYDCAVAAIAPGTGLSSWETASAWREFLSGNGTSPALRYWY